MKKIFMLVILFGIFLSGCSNKQDINLSNQNQEIKTGSNYDEKTKIDIKVETGNQIKLDKKIEIVLFHGTYRCYSCNTMEELIKKTLNENFKKEMELGNISFKAINGELPENTNIVNKYRSTGLSVFINSITNGKDNIQEETNAWRLISNEAKFKEYLNDKIKNLIIEK